MLPETMASALCMAMEETTASAERLEVLEVPLLLQ